MVENVADPRSNLERAIQVGIDAALIDLHTGMPGEVISFDPVEQTADIQLVIKSKQKGELVNRSVLKAVPVRYMSSQAFSITFPLVAGDEVCVQASERSIDVWLANGGIQDPSDIRKHSFSDAFCFPMMYSQPNKVTNFDPDNLQIRTADASGTITIKANGDVEINGNADFAVAFDDLKTAFNELQNKFNTHGGHYSPTNVVPNPQSAADIELAKVATVRLP